MKVLITGGRGFVGSYVVKELSRYGHEVIILSNLSHPSKNTNGWAYMYGDIRYEYDVNRAADVDCIINLAAKINVDRSREDSRPFFDTNVLGTFNVLEVVRKRGIKLIQASTSEALGSMQERFCGDSTIGPNPKSLYGMAENHPYSPDNPYGATKAAADMLVLGWIKSFDINAAILRSFNITGIGQSYDKEGAFIPKTIEAIVDDRNPVIFGSGEQTRDYVWAGDVARAYRLMVEKDVKGEIFHFGSGVDTSIKYVAQKLIEYSRKPLQIEYIQARPKEVKKLKCDYSKAKQILGWTPTKYIDEILFDMYNDRLLREFE